MIGGSNPLRCSERILCVESSGSQVVKAQDIKLNPTLNVVAEHVSSKRNPHFGEGRPFKSDSRFKSYFLRNGAIVGYSVVPQNL